MKAFTILILICALIASALSSTVFTKDYSDPKHPGKCVFDGTVYEPGKHELGELVWFTCEENGQGTYIASYPIRKPTTTPPPPPRPVQL